MINFEIVHIYNSTPCAELNGVMIRDPDCGLIYLYA